MSDLKATYTVTGSNRFNGNSGTWTVAINEESTTIEDELESRGIIADTITKEKSEEVKTKEEIKAEGKNTYKVSWFNMSMGKTYEEIVKADSEQEAEIKVDCNQRCKVEIVEEETEAVEHIIDAEELLFNMDAEGVDEITTTEGLNGKLSNTYTRKQIEAYLSPKVTASQKAKDAGFKSLAQVIELSETPRSTLVDWVETKPVLFNVILLGCAKKLELQDKLDLDQQTKIKNKL